VIHGHREGSAAYSAARLEYVRISPYNTYLAKLTLSVDKDVVRRAKRYAVRRGTSISRLVERYLSLLAGPRPEAGEGWPGVVARLRGALKGASGDTTEYRRYLERKYR